MGNACVAGGGCPHTIDIVITNDTKYELELDQNQDCGQECKHKGFILSAGKIVEGREPPQVIEPFSHVTFSASGREGTAVAPVGKVFYVNDQENLKIMVSWANAGWTTREGASADSSVTGAKSGMMSTKPWSEILEVKKNLNSWAYTIQKKESTVKKAIEAVKDVSDSVKNFSVI